MRTTKINYKKYLQRNQKTLKYYTLETSPTIKKLNEEFKKLSKEEQDKIINEVKSKMYGALSNS